MKRERNNLLTTLVLLAGFIVISSAQPSDSEIQRRRELLSKLTVVNGKLVRKTDVGSGDNVTQVAPSPNVTQVAPSPIPEVTTSPQTKAPNATQPEEPFANAARNTSEPASTSASELVGLFSANNLLLNQAESGLKVNVSQQEIDELAAKITPSDTNKAIVFGEINARKIGQSAAKVFSPGSNTSEEVEAFGPHLLTSLSASTIGRTADKFLAASQQLKTDLKLTPEQARVLKAVPLTNIKSAFDCPYDDPIICNPSSKYRTFDGSCNNLANPFYGKADTPFERFLPAKYEDGIGEMKKTGAGSGFPLPNPRFISTRYHTSSFPYNKQFGVSLLTMTYGQFVSHDVNMNTISRGTGGSFLRCCGGDGRITSDPSLIDLGCEPIEIPPNDPFFAQFGRQCLSFIRALGGTDLKCSLGGREQINQVTHYLDASGVYGSDDETIARLRSFTDGLLKSDVGPDGRELLLQSPNSAGTSFCKSAVGSNHHCFRAGDVRVNQNNNLITIHTLFLREHNRLARGLKPLNPLWTDEKLFQEARKINIAQFQHITYNEYLPVLLSRPVAEFFKLVAQPSGYYGGYSETINPAIRNSFVAAAYRSGHSTITDFLAAGFDLKSSLNNPTGVYNPGIDSFVASITRNPQQTMDRFDSSAITNTLFEGRPGSGIDLAATNIQRGRDHGLPSYNDFREFCGMPRARFFGNSPGGLIHHSQDAIFGLAGVYRHVDDIDAWTGMSSELPMEGGVFGATASCVVGLQFYYTKRGDRYYYENDDEHTKFTPGQLNSIRTTSLSALFCANTGQSQIARNSFLSPSPDRNPFVTCGSLPLVDLSRWSQSSCVDGGWTPFGPWTPCANSFQFRFRFCENPAKNHCGKDCVGDNFVYKFCLFGGIVSGTESRNAARTTIAPLNLGIRSSPNTTVPVFIRQAALRAGGRNA